MGETLPYMIERIQAVTGRWGKKRTLEDVWNSNLWITTSGMFSLNSMRCLIGACAKDRVLFSVDYPFSTNETGQGLSWTRSQQAACYRRRNSRWWHTGTQKSS
ncbi:hypothetical protein MRB53_039823 [Persea americana]|nr:hypothetical protein MRB53_039823 [Persea americana]